MVETGWRDFRRWLALYIVTGNKLSKLENTMTIQAYHPNHIRQRHRDIFFFVIVIHSGNSSLPNFP